MDALAFIHLGGFFVSFMSGNSTRLGVGLAEQASDASLAGGLILAFVLGVAAGSLLGHFAQGRRREAVLAVVGTLLAIAAGCDLAGLGATAIGATAFAMGALNAVFEHEGEVRIGLTYMTGSLVKVGQGLARALVGRVQWGWSPYLLLWAGFAAGACAGALGYPRFGLGGLWLAAATALLLGWYARRSGAQESDT